jgi:hypothetical protein
MKEIYKNKNFLFKIFSISSGIVIIYIYKYVFQKRKKKTIHITGFGKFKGVKENPSQLLMEYFEKNQKLNFESIKVIETSIEGIKK